MPATRNNRATIVVYMPDGCRLEWTTKKTGPLARDAKQFADWLIETGEFIKEGATTDGMHAACKQCDEAS